MGRVSRESERGAGGRGCGCVGAGSGAFPWCGRVRGGAGRRGRRCVWAVGLGAGEEVVGQASVGRLCRRVGDCLCVGGVSAGPGGGEDAGTAGVRRWKIKNGGRTDGGLRGPAADGRCVTCRAACVGLRCAPIGAERRRGVWGSAGVEGVAGRGCFFPAGSGKCGWRGGGVLRMWMKGGGSGEGGGFFVLAGVRGGRK